MTTIQFAPAVRERVSLLIALAGASGSGKTLSALKIARGLAGGDDNQIGVVDTEARRARHYAVAKGERQGPNKFAFQAVDLRPPFTPEAYMAAIEAAESSGLEVIMIDSCSHEWEGEGGLHDIQAALVEAAVEKARANHSGSYPFDEGRAAERASVGAWKEPKRRHKRFVSRLLQCRAHLVLCLRADEKLRMETVEEEGRNGKTYKKTVIIQAKDLPPAERWVPICEKRFMYEMTASFVLTPDRPGIPIPIKLQEQHRHAAPEGKHLSEQTGRTLAEWARGGEPKPAQQELGRAKASPLARPADGGFPGDVQTDIRAAARDKAREGTSAFNAWWSALPGADQDAIAEIGDELYEIGQAAAARAARELEATA